MSKLLAPNGKPSNLTPEQYKLVRTPAFKKWFGDWENDSKNSSKVVDKNGEPLVVYHGSRSRLKFAFSEFNVPNEGVYFSSDYTTATWFSSGYDYKLQFQEIELPNNLNENSSIEDLEKYFKKNIDPTAYTEINTFDDGTIMYRLNSYNESVSSPLGQNLKDAKARLFKEIQYEIESINNKSRYPFYNVFLNIRNPYKIDAKGNTFDETPFENGNYSAVSVTSEIKSRGKNDGVIIKNTIETTELNRKSNSYIVFNSNQIKLADGTNTTFDSKNNDIRYDGGGNVEDDDYYDEYDRFWTNEYLVHYLFSQMNELKHLENKNLILSHDEKITFKEENNQGRISMKPLGLWYAKGFEWVDWIQFQMPSWSSKYHYLHEIKTSDKVLKINNKVDAIKFSVEYGVYEENSFDITEYTRIDQIDWERVAKNWSGIEMVNPRANFDYLTDRRLRWVGSWDVASGCVWKKDGIDEIKLLINYKNSNNPDIRFNKGGRTFNDKELLKKYNNGESIGFTAIAHLKSKGLIERADGTKRKSMSDGGLTKNKMDKKIKLSKEEMKDFNLWMQDGNVSKNPDGSYSTQDAQWRNNLKDLDALKEYYAKEFLSDGRYENGGTTDDKHLMAKAIEFIIGTAIDSNSIQIEPTKILFKRKNSSVQSSLNKKLIEDTIRMHGKSLKGRYERGGVIEVVGKGSKGAFRKREYQGMTEKEVADFWIERGYTMSKSKSESKLKPFTFYIEKYEDGGQPVQYVPVQQPVQYVIQQPTQQGVSLNSAIDFVKQNPQVLAMLEKGGEAGFDDTNTSSFYYHEKQGNFLVPKNEIYMWLYEGEGVNEKMESGEYDYVFYPYSSMSMAWQKGFIPPLKKIWTKKFQKDHKGSEHLLGVIKAYLLKDGKELYIDMMSVNPTKKKKGIMSYMIKELRDIFNLTQDQVRFSDLTKEGEKFVGKKTYADGGSISNFIKKTYGNLVEKQGILTTKTKWLNKDGVKVLEYGFDPYRNEESNTLFYYSWDYKDSGMDYDDFRNQLVDFFKKTYKKEVSELKALYVGWERKEKDEYADGGDIPHEDKMFQLPLEMVVYVPSTQDVDKVISVDKMESRVDEVKQYLASKFGGYTSSDKLGGYVDSTGNLVNEDVVQVTSFSTKEAYAENKEELIQQLAKWGKEWGQEAIGFEFEGDLMYVPQEL